MLTTSTGVGIFLIQCLCYKTQSEYFSNAAFMVIKNLTVICVATAHIGGHANGNYRDPITPCSIITQQGVAGSW